MRKSAKFVRVPAIVLGVVLAACTGAAQAASYIMFRDPGCPCCEEWAVHLKEQLGYEIIARDDPAIQQLKADKGVPADLASCHTMEVEGYMIEGHVPAREIERLLAEKPPGVKGLAVAGMPLGSPGMDAGDRVQPYEVIAFGDFGRRVYASYP